MSAMGDTAVFSGLFNTSIRPPEFDQYFEESWPLPWKVGWYHRTTTYLDKSTVGNPHTAISASYSKKTNHVK